jgi:hypothetical protein
LGWSWDRESNGNTWGTRIFTQVQASRRIIVLCHIFFYCSWQLMWWLLFFRGCPSPPFISKWARVTRKVPESVTIIVLVGLYIYLPICKIWSYPSRTLSLENMLSPSYCNMGLCWPPWTCQVISIIYPRYASSTFSN